MLQPKLLNKLFFLSIWNIISSLYQAILYLNIFPDALFCHWVICLFWCQCHVDSSHVGCFYILIKQAKFPLSIICFWKFPADFCIFILPEEVYYEFLGYPSVTTPPYLPQPHETKNQRLRKKWIGWDGHNTWVFPSAYAPPVACSLQRVTTSSSHLLGPAEAGGWPWALPLFHSPSLTHQCILLDPVRMWPLLTAFPPTTWGLAFLILSSGYCNSLLTDVPAFTLNSLKSILITREQSY